MYLARSFPLIKPTSFHLPTESDIFSSDFRYITLGEGSALGSFSTFVVMLKFRVGAFEQQSLLRIEEQKMNTTTAIGETKLVLVVAAAYGLLYTAGRGRDNGWIQFQVR
jgi:hypothetical protein